MNDDDDDLDYISLPPLSTQFFRYVPLKKFEDEKERGAALIKAMKKARDLLWYRDAEAYGVLDEAIKAYES
jgi:hypothetical protein